AQIISYEEYYPYGSTSYQAVNQNIKAAAKRYRYTGTERDGESGLYFNAARYYAVWLNRWISTDPAGLLDSPNLYQFARLNPLVFVDKTGTQCDSDIVNCGNPNDPGKYQTFEDFQVGAVGPWTKQGLRDEWERVHSLNERDIHQITLITRSFAP